MVPSKVLISSGLPMLGAAAGGPVGALLGSMFASQIGNDMQGLSDMVRAAKSSNSYGSSSLLDSVTSGINTADEYVARTGTLQEIVERGLELLVENGLPYVKGYLDDVLLHKGPSAASAAAKSIGRSAGVNIPMPAPVATGFGIQPWMKWAVFGFLGLAAIKMLK